MARHGAPLDVVRPEDQSPSLRGEGFTVFPIRVVHHMRDYFYVQYDREALEQECAGYDATSIPVSMQNIGQHGHSFHKVESVPPESGEVHAAIALKRTSVTGPGGNTLCVLVGLVTDAGPGIKNPANCMVNGVSNSIHGDQGCGMGWELNHSLIYLIRSTSNGWFAFDGFAYSKQQRRDVNQYSQEALTARVEPIGQVDLPSPGVGCQKMFFCPEKDCADSDKQWLVEQITKALTHSAT